MSLFDVFRNFIRRDQDDQRKLGTVKIVQGFAAHAAMFLEPVIVQYTSISGIGGEVALLRNIA